MCVIIPIIIFVITFFILSIGYLVFLLKEKSIQKFFISHGYERKLLDVSSVGAKSFYGWVRESDNKIADDRDIKGWSLNEIKEEYE